MKRGVSFAAKLGFVRGRILPAALLVVLAQCCWAQSSATASGSEHKSAAQKDGQSASTQGAELPLKQSESPSQAEKASSEKTADLEREFFAAIREADTKKVLSYVPVSGINYGKEPQHLTRIDVEEQLLHRRGLYCMLFDSECIDGEIELDASARTCSDRELLTHSDKVRTAATIAVRNNVRQAILVAEVKNPQCPNQNLIDFIFNFEHGEWKLFSVP